MLHSISNENIITIYVHMKRNTFSVFTVALKCIYCTVNDHTEPVEKDTSYLAIKYFQTSKNLVDRK